MVRAVEILNEDGLQTLYQVHDSFSALKVRGYRAPIIAKISKQEGVYLSRKGIAKFIKGHSHKKAGMGQSNRRNVDVRLQQYLFVQFYIEELIWTGHSMAAHTV